MYIFSHCSAYSSLCKLPIPWQICELQKNLESRLVYLIEIILNFIGLKIHKFNNTALILGIYCKTITKEINLGIKIKFQENLRIVVPNNFLIDVDINLLSLTPIGNRAQASESGGLQER